MNQLIAVALGGSLGSVLRFLVSTGTYQWLGRGFPYGTLAVNVIGSFLIGLLAEALILQRIAFALEYRAGILVGIMGGFTTFSSFSLETIYLIEQGSFTKAALNVLISLIACLLAVWLGLLSGRSLFLYSDGVIQWPGGMFPYALVVVNAIGAFLIGIVATVLLQKVAMSMEYRAAIMIIIVGLYLTLSGLYLILYLIEHGYSFETHLNLMLGIFVGNGLISILVLWAGLWVGRQI
ncbi:MULTISPECIES: fluoride efflux transporter CrcB [Methylobacter]|uniref:fluoride efflux transporter CrcB n=1 Tax=Methylobacter TaxID=429 RepID=UPI000425131F|nr:fluoride efflux transporter CrcB [Methylobacter luteus]